MVFFAGLQFFVDALHRQKGIQKLEHIRKNLFQIRSQSDNESYIQKQLDFMCGLLAETEIKKANMQNSLKDFQAKNGDFFNFRFFGADKKHIPLDGESKKFRSLITKIFKSLSRAETDSKTDLLKANKVYFNTFLGEVAPEEILAQRAALLKVELNGQAGYFYWNTFYSQKDNWKFKGGIVVFFKEKNIPRNFAVERIVKEFSRQAGNEVSYGFIDYRKSSRQIYIAPSSGKKSNHSKSDRIASELKKMRFELSATRKTENQLITSVQLNPYKDIFCVYKLVKQQVLNWLFVLRAFLIAFFIFFSKILFDKWHQNRLEDFFARHRISLSMIYMTVPALFVLVAGGIIQIYNVNQSYIDEYRGRLLAFANSIDDNYKNYLNDLEKDLGKLKKTLSNFDKQNSNHLRFCRELENERKIKQILLLDKKGRSFFSYPKETTSNPVFERLAPALAARFFAIKSQGKRNFKDQVGDMIFDSFMQKFIPFLGNSENVSQFMRIFSTTDEILEFSFTDKKYYIFTTFIENSKAETKDLLLLSVTDAADFSKEFLRNHIQRNKKLYDEGRVGRQLAMIPKRQNKAPFPLEFSKYPFAFSMRERILSTETAQTSVEEMDGQKSLVLATPLKYVPDHILFVIKPVGHLSNKLYILTFKLFAVVFICLFISFYVVKWVNKNTILGKGF
ncbi:MAG: hypothetical protein ACQETH_10810, partial [Candidatus Rifleibacteriota bacterium]